MVKDYQILKEAIIKALADSSLDIGAQYFILKDTFREVENRYFCKINGELMGENSAEPYNGINYEKHSRDKDKTNNGNQAQVRIPIQNVDSNVRVTG